MATRTSLDRITFGELAKATDLSKSGLFAHFKSRDNLQIAVLEYAGQLFAAKVIEPINTDTPPLERLKMLMDNWLNWFNESAHNCIFMSAITIFDTQPGPMRDLLQYQLERWLNYLESVAQEIVEAKVFKKNTHCKQFAFELYSLYLCSQTFRWLDNEKENRKYFKKGFEDLINRHLV
ncbi:TetR/AcrR family transcriptional regulator [Aliikangiella sp. IMCC44359]|uniref:TetR/AcrR family transcriptional regulator n=1 Tax=Aliikangiella sp. IMCC44359 TaxID=3459125 RepID=UPI00403AC00A